MASPLIERERCSRSTAMATSGARLRARPADRSLSQASSDATAWRRSAIEVIRGTPEDHSLLSALAAFRGTFAPQLETLQLLDRGSAPIFARENHDRASHFASLQFSR